MQEHQTPKKAAASLIGEVGNEEFNWTVTLRNGEQTDARNVISGLEMLHELVPNRMDALQMLVELHEGRITPDDLPADIRERFANPEENVWSYLIRPTIANAVIKTPNGLELTDPFVEGEHTEFVLRELERRQQRATEKFMNSLRDDSDDLGWTL